MSIRVAKLPGFKEKFYVESIPKPTPGPRDVLVRVEACTLVPNSKNVVSDPNPNEGYSLPKFPCSWGLDSAGTIEAVGEHVQNLKVGDRVYVDPYLTCDSCPACRRGQRSACPNWCLRAYFGMGPGGEATLRRYPLGGLSEYLLSPDTNIAILPSSIDFQTAARFGYVGTSFSGLKKAGMGPGKTILINGVTGTLGYAAVAVALGLGCTKILGTGRNKERLEQVRKLGPSGRIEVCSTEDVDDIPAWVLEKTGGFGPDGFYDCLGVGGNSESTMNLIRTVHNGGKAVLAAGGVKGQINQSYLEAFARDVPIVGTVWFSSAELDELVALVGAGIIDLSFLDHHFYTLDQVNEAIVAVGDRPGGGINIVVQPGKSSSK